MFYVVNLDLGNQDEPIIALVLKSASKKNFAIAEVGESAAGGQMLLSKDFVSVNKLFLSEKGRAPDLDISSL